MTGRVWDMPKIIRVVGQDLVCVAGLNLSVLDATNPAQPVFKGLLETPEVPITGFTAANGYGYVTCGNNPGVQQLAVVRINLD